MTGITRASPLMALPASESACFLRYLGLILQYTHVVVGIIARICINVVL